MKTQILVTCYDHIRVATGVLDSIHDLECNFLSDELSPTPLFARKSRILLNLFNEDTCETMNVSARLASVSRINGKWAYRIKWQGIPPIIKDWVQESS